MIATIIILICLVLFLSFVCYKLYRRISNCEKLVLSVTRLSQNTAQLAESSSKSVRSLTEVVGSLNQDYEDFQNSMVTFVKEITAYLEKLAGKGSSESNTKKINLN